MYCFAAFLLRNSSSQTTSCRKTRLSRGLQPGSGNENDVALFILVELRSVHRRSPNE